MAKFYCFENQGELDPRALTLLGASSKSDGNSIGFFGSGFKYAIACLLRNGIAISVYSGERRIEIGTVATTFGGADIDIVTVDGIETSLTTRTGPKWEIRDAIREIWSNCLDEGGAERFEADVAFGEAGRSRVYIDMHEALQHMLSDWYLYFLPERNDQVLFECEAGRLLWTGGLPSQYYRRGVWITEDRKTMGNFIYDFKEFNLPESRKVSSDTAAYDMYKIISYCDAKPFWIEMLKHTDDTRWETEWKGARYLMTKVAELLGSLVGDKKIGMAVNKDLRAFDGVNALWCGAIAYQVLKTIGIPTVEDDFKLDDRYEIIPTWPIGVKERVDASISFLKKNDIDLSNKEIHFAKFKSEDIIAMADQKYHRLLLGDAAIEADDKMLLKALIEEWTHLIKNVGDYSVEQQHVYLDVIVRLLTR